MQLFGIGQGSDGGPAVWLFHITSLFEFMHDFCDVPTYNSLNEKLKVTTTDTGYVDDCNLQG